MLEHGPVLLVTSGGGHFSELAMLADQWGVPEEARHWVAPRTPQTEHALADAAGRTWVGRIDSRQLGRATLRLPAAVRLHRRLRPTALMSTGAAQAVPHLVAAALSRTPMHYVESVARTDGPSLTGRIAHRLGAELYSQGPGWGPAWQPVPDIYSAFTVVESPARRIERAVVALGTEQFPFVRAIEAVRGVLDPDVEVTWQVGRTTYETPDGPLNRWLPADVLDAALAQASVVVVHGGAGSVLSALRSGKVPVVMARSAYRGEHVDDHQLTMCEMLAERGLVVLVRPDEALTHDHLLTAARRRASLGPVETTADG